MEQAMLRKILLAGAATLGVLGTATAADAFTITTPSLTDVDFNALLLNGEFSELFVAESRMGNNALNGDREFGINQAIAPNSSGVLAGGDPFMGAEGQRTWVSGQAVAFELSYDALTGAIAYTVGGKTLTASTNTFDPNGIFLRTRAQGRNDSSSASLVLQNLMLDDGSGFQLISDLFSTSTGIASDVDYLVISGLKGSFTLKGEEVFSWTGALPSGSRLATQIKVGGGTYTQGEDPQPVPEPMMAIGALVAVGAGLARKRNTAA
jgi:hypothetical protein